MARLSGVDLPKNKRIEIALTYIFGVGPELAKKILEATRIDPNTLTRDISEEEVLKIREQVSKLVVEGDLRRQVSQNVKRLIDIGSYRGKRHKAGQPVRGQRTHTNARTKKGRRVAVAGKKKATK